jgi:hypothetical protein
MQLIFSEMAEVKPIGFLNQYWWGKEDFESRVKAFDKLIELTKPEQSTSDNYD